MLFFYTAFNVFTLYAASSVFYELYQDFYTFSSMDPPIIYELNAWSLHVTWEPPAVPNGVIESYKLYQNKQLIESFPGNVTQHEADYLTPFTSYGYM